MRQADQKSSFPLDARISPWLQIIQSVEVLALLGFFAHLPQPRLPSPRPPFFTSSSIWRTKWACFLNCCESPLAPRGYQFDPPAMPLALETHRFGNIAVFAGHHSAVASTKRPVVLRMCGKIEVRSLLLGVVHPHRDHLHPERVNPLHTIHGSVF